jgi:endonuclease/exonuclease/phosphatase (EEP) superfamily protein YafD
MRRLLLISATAEAALLAVLLLALEWRAESHWLFTVLLFAPPQFFLLPALFFVPAALMLREWRVCALQAACVFVVIIGYMHLRWRTAAVADSAALTLVTHNAGEGNRQQFNDFVAAQKPDVILLQDVKGRGSELDRRYAGYNVAVRGEFICLSRSLIEQSKLLETPNWRGRPVMARYEIIFHGAPLALYDIHLPTPRNELSRFLGARAALAMFGNEELPGGRSSMRDWNAQRRELYRETAAVLASEPLPCVVAGDFNMPDHGILYHDFRKSLSDAFAETGSGSGFTFPGNMKSIVALLGPWLRIDYVFAGRGWTPVSCQPDPGLLSQHRPVVARLRSSQVAGLRSQVASSSTPSVEFTSTWDPGPGT